MHTRWLSPSGRAPNPSRARHEATGTQRPLPLKLTVGGRFRGHSRTRAPHGHLIATYRARMLAQGHTPKVESRNKPTVTALREVAAGQIGREMLRRVPT